jgi:hypothetical protein
MLVRSAPLLLAATIAATLAITSCGGDDEAEDQASDRRVELIVGDVLPLSGPDAGTGASAQKAAQLAVEKINDAIGEADADHTLEIVHEDGAGLGARAIQRLLAAGAGCLVGPWRIGLMRRAARLAARSEPRALLIDPSGPVGAPRRAGPMISLPLSNPTRLLDLEASVEDPSVEFARLYATTDPPIGRARAADARQFDSVILCYLAAVAAGSDSGARMAASVHDAVHDAPPMRPVLAWPELAEAVELLQRGIPVTYRGVTLRAHLRP